VVRYIFTKIASALHQLHKDGFAHRDIKPENIILTEKFDIKLIDFGFTTNLAGSDQTGFMKTSGGTQMYMSPQLLEKRPYQGADADIFAFGVTLLVTRLFDYPFVKAAMSDQKYK